MPRIALLLLLSLFAAQAGAQKEEAPPPAASESPPAGDDTTSADAAAAAEEQPGDVEVPPQWTFAINPYGLRTAVAQGIANFGSKRWPATLTLQCAPGHDGNLSWILKIAGAHDSDGFDFGAFEGPDAAANGKQLTQLALEGGLLTTRFATTQTGSFTTSDEFAFEVNAGAWATSNGALLADAVGAQTQAILWSLRSPAEASQVIVARISADGAAAVLRDTMQGCGPVPKFDVATLARWSDGDSTAMWRDRALVWRLKGVLGTHYDTFANLSWPRDALDKDGAVYYALATPDDAGNGGALMLNADGLLEVLLVEGGNLTRYSWNRGALKAPQAVRDYLAGVVKSEISPPDVN